jgi:hypothetical protein
VPMAADDIYAVLLSETIDTKMNHKLLMCIFALANNDLVRNAFIEASPFCVEVFGLLERAEQEKVKNTLLHGKSLPEMIIAKLMVILSLVIDSRCNNSLTIARKVSLLHLVSSLFSHLVSRLSSRLSSLVSCLVSRLSSLISSLVSHLVSRLVSSRVVSCRLVSSRLISPSPN